MFSNDFFLKIIGFYLKNFFFFVTYNLEEENIMKDIRNIFRLEKELNYTAIKDIRNLFRLEKEIKAINDKILREIENLFEYEE